jgi:uncharacterized protein YdaU (DUF1376 family)
MNHYPHHIGDFDKATRHLNRLERSIYRDLLDVYYETESPLTLELDKLKRKILATTEQESTAVEQVLTEFFLETPNGWFHSRCDAEILKFQDNTTQKALAGKASAAAKALRKQHALNGRLTDVQRHFNGTSTNQNLEPEPRTNKEKSANALTAYAALLADVPSQIVDDWKALRKAKKAPITKTVIEGAISEAAKAGMSLTDFLAEWCSRGSQGLKAEWLTSPKSANYEPPYAKYMREKVEKMSPSIAAPNPNNPSQVKRIDPNEFLRTIEAKNVIRIN